MREYKVYRDTSKVFLSFFQSPVNYSYSLSRPFRRDLFPDFARSLSSKKPKKNLNG